MLRIKRVYDKPDAGDGRRIYVDRLWPRGLKKEDAAIDEWLKELSPSDALRKWFGHEPDRFEDFRKRYIEELSAHENLASLERLASMAKEADVTLLYSAKNTEYNNAVVLKEFIVNTVSAKSGK